MEKLVSESYLGLLIQLLQAIGFVIWAIRSEKNANAKHETIFQHIKHLANGQSSSDSDEPSSENSPLLKNKNDEKGEKEKKPLLPKKDVVNNKDVNKNKNIKINEEID